MSDERAREIADEVAKLDAYLARLGGCTDGYCIIVKPKGMHTNGGCRCNTDRTKISRFAYAHNDFHAAVRRILEEGNNGNA